MAGETQKQSNTTQQKSDECKTPSRVRPPEILFAAAGGGLIGGAIGAAVAILYLTGG